MSEEVKIFEEGGAEFHIPVEGSIGLLALGHHGINAWRAKRKEAGYDVVAEKKKLVATLEKEKKEKEEKDGKEAGK